MEAKLRSSCIIEQIQFDCPAFCRYFSTYINGIYKASPDNPLVNGRLSYHKERTDDEHPDIFFMYRNERWFVAFFAPGQGKQMTAIGHFETDALDPSKIVGSLNVAGALDDGVIVACEQPTWKYGMRVPTSADSCEADRGGCDSST
jgi:hypothetical protein